MTTAQNFTAPNLVVPMARSRVGTGAWSSYETTTLENIAATLRILDATDNWKVVTVSYGRPTKGDREGVPTMIELRAGNRGRYQYRYFIPTVADAKRLIAGSAKVMKFLGKTSADQL